MRNLAFALVSLACAAPAAAGPLADIEIYDRTAGRALATHEHEGRTYVAGTPGHEYRVTIRSRHGGRLLAVTSVDGVNVVTGETAAPAQSGYVIEPYGSVTIKGWRKSLEETAAFVFTPHRNSYAARTGRPFDVGVIGVALFREKGPCCDWRGPGTPEALPERDAAAAPGAAVPQLQRRHEERQLDSQRRQEQLGTGHGRREHDAARHTEFERETATPAHVLAVYYDSRANLVAQGVIRDRRDYAQRRPRPFPGAFVPDP